MRQFWLIRPRLCITSWKRLTHGSFARSWYPNAWFTALCCALWLPQLLLDSILALVISSDNSRTVQIWLFSEYDPGATQYLVKISTTVWTRCVSQVFCIPVSFLCEGKIIIMLTPEEFPEDPGSWEPLICGWHDVCVGIITERRSKVDQLGLWWIVS